MFLGTTYCVRCLTEFEERSCCCDNGTHDDGSHDEGLCVACCGPHARRALGAYERMDCDQ